MDAKNIDFFWDAASPYTYLASTQVGALAERTGAAVTWKPFLLGKAFEACGNKMPASIPAKGKYMFEDLKLWKQSYGVPFEFPKKFPMNSVAALRCACAAETLGRQPAFALAVMKAYWAEGADISKPEVLVAIAGSVGLDGSALLGMSQEPAAKDALRANTDEAVRRGIFGAPTFFVGPQMFWGNDRLGLLEQFVQGKLAA